MRWIASLPSRAHPILLISTPTSPLNPSHPSQPVLPRNASRLLPLARSSDLGQPKFHQITRLDIIPYSVNPCMAAAPLYALRIETTPRLDRRLKSIRKNTSS